MAEETALLLLRIVMEYEAASRETLIRNVRKANIYRTSELLGDEIVLELVGRRV